VGSNKTVMNKEGNSCGSLLHHTYWTKSSYGEVPAREVGRDGALIAILTQSSRQAPFWAVRLDCFHPRTQVEINPWGRGISHGRMTPTVLRQRT
jgi:hypothetical protein